MRGAIFSVQKGGVCPEGVFPERRRGPRGPARVHGSGPLRPPVLRLGVGATRRALSLPCLETGLSTFRADLAVGET